MISIFLKKTILFFIPIILLGIGLEVYLRNRTNLNEILAKFELVKDRKDTEVIFIGNSHGRNAFIPAQITQKSLNLCIGGSDTFYNSHFLESIIDSMPHLREIVCNISYHTLFSDQDMNLDERKKYEFFHYLNVDAGVDKYSLDYYSVLSTLGMKRAINVVVNDFNSPAKSWIETSGHKEDYRTINSKLISMHSVERLKKHHSIMNTEKVNVHIEHLDHLENIAREKRIDVTYVILPVINNYKKLWESKYEKFKLILKSFADSNGSRLIIVSDSLDFKDEDFADPDHVNMKGAQKISKHLNKLISKESH